MAKFIVAGQTEVSFDDSTGGLRLMSAYVDSMTSMARSFAQIDITTFVDSAERFINGIELSQEFSVEGPFDDTADVGPDDLFTGIVGGTARTFRFDPVGTTAGSRRFQAEVICSSYQVVSAVKDKVGYIATFKVDNVMTVSTI